MDALGTINHLNALASAAEGESVLAIASIGAILPTSSSGNRVGAADQTVLATRKLELGEPQHPIRAGDVGGSGSLDLFDPETCSSANCDLEVILGDIAADVANRL